MLADSPDVVISTPGRAAQNINSANFSLEKLTHLVIDEADLVLSYGHETDLDTIAKALPRGVQSFLMSATFTAETNTLKGLFCRDPAVLKLGEKETEGRKIPQYVVKCAEDEKFLLTYVIFKLQLISGKCIIFVNGVDRSYCLKLFLEQFGIKSCVLNSELPINSRIHTVEEFNKGIYDKIIAADDQEVLGCVAPRRTSKRTAHAEVADQGDDFEEAADDHAIKRQRLTAKQKDYSTSRGIDLQDIACVLNFDLPSSSKSYTHRIGRTARAGKNGMVLSFAIPTHLYRIHKATSIPSTKHDERVLEKIVAAQAKNGKEVHPYHFDTKRVDPFRYRMNDALRAVSQNAVRKARTRELKQELVKSDKLKRHFEENPEDLRNLRHDGEIRATRVQPHLKHVPQYLISSSGTTSATADEPEAPFSSVKKGTIRKTRPRPRLPGQRNGKDSKDVQGGGGRRADPLKSFKATVAS
jgi:ATP-dependent RNA helicase DDX56/DBP9